MIQNMLDRRTLGHARSYFCIDTDHRRELGTLLSSTSWQLLGPITQSNRLRDFRLEMQGLESGFPTHRQGSPQSLCSMEHSGYFRLEG